MWCRSLRWDPSRRLRSDRARPRAVTTIWRSSATPLRRSAPLIEALDPTAPGSILSRHIIQASGSTHRADSATERWREHMNLDRRSFAKSVTGVVGSLIAGEKVVTASTQSTPAALAPAQTRLAPAKITRIRVFYPLNYDRNGPQAFPQSNMVVLVDTEAGITGIGQGGSPDTIRNVARSVIGRKALDTQAIWQGAVIGGLFPPGQGKLHAPGPVE